MLVPLPRRLLFQNKLRLLASLVGVGVAVLLVLQNLALYRGVQHYASILVQRVGGDLWVVSPGTQFFELGNSMELANLYRVRSIPGVESAERLNYLPAGFSCRSGNAGPISFIGVDPTRTAITSLLIQGDPSRLADIGGAIVDRSIIRKCPLEIGDTFRGVTAGDPRFHVIGFTEGLSPLTTIPYAFVSIATMQSFSSAAPDIVTFVAATAKPGTDLLLLKKAIARAVAPNEVLTRDEFLLRHDLYWKRTADLRIILLITSVLALFVGLLVVGQTVYSSTLEHLRQFGTLKAIGASNTFVVRVVLQQALLAGFLGFLFGVLVSVPVGVVIARFLPSEMTVGHALTALVLVGVICLVSALAPIRKVIQLEPTEVFR